MPDWRRAAVKLEALHAVNGFQVQPRADLEDAWIKVKCNTCGAIQSLTNLGNAGEYERDPSQTTFQIAGGAITRTISCASGHNGSIKYSVQRLAPTYYKVAVLAKCTDEKEHPKRRIVTSYISLIILHRLVSTDRVKDNAIIEAPGAQIQRQGSPAGRDNQLAHQIIREITIDGKFFYTLPNLEPDEKDALVYCHSVCSDIHKDYNTADGFVEKKARTPYLALAKEIVKNEFTMFTNIAYPKILDKLFALFEKACQDSLTEQPPQKIADIITQYGKDALVVKAAASQISSKSLDYWVGIIKDGGIKKV